MKAMQFALLLVITGVGVVNMYWLFEPEKPFIEFTRLVSCDSGGKDKEQFRAGETLFTCREGRVLKHTPRIVTITIVNDDTNTIYHRTEPVMAVQNRVGPFKFNLRVIEVPDAFTPGNYSVRTSMVYSLNPLRNKEVFIAPIIPFRVAK